MPDVFVFDEYAMDEVPVDHEVRLLRLFVKELEAERDAALARAALWKRAATLHFFDREHRQWCVWRYELRQGLSRFPGVRYAPMIRRALGLPDAE